MTPSLTAVRKAKKRIAREYRKMLEEHSWRVLAERYPPIKFGTLQRFVNDPAYIPTDIQILIALGLKKPPKLKAPPAPLPEWLRKIKKQIAGMAKDTRRERNTHGIR